MNKKGQTLILFVIMLPILILLLAIVVDVGIILKENTKLNSTTKSILKTTYEERFQEDYKEKVRDLYKKNNLPTEDLIIEVYDQTIRIQNTYKKESILGKIVGIKEYTIKGSLKVEIKEDSLIIEKE